MKVIIWGAGQKGKKALEIFGKENVLFFVDRNQEIVETRIDGIEVKEINEVVNHKDAIIIVTPSDYADEISEYLLSLEMRNFFVFDEHPLPIDLSEGSGTLEDQFEFVVPGNKIALVGLDWFSVYLYHFFEAQGAECLIVDYQNRRELAEILRLECQIVVKDQWTSDGYLIIGSKNACDDVDEFIDLEKYVNDAYRKCEVSIQAFKNINKGKRCFIVATGPSLMVSDLDTLYNKHEICMSMNRIYNIFEQTHWRPDYYVIEDQKMIEDLEEEIAELNLDKKFVSSIPSKYWQNPKSKSSIPFNMVMQALLDDNVGFSCEADKFMYNGCTVTYVCIQLAVYMGFTDIYLLGVDFNYSKDIYDIKNHFAGYQRKYKDIRLNQVFPEKTLRAYEKAKEITECKEVHIYNATRGGKLEVFPRVDFDSLFT